MAAAPSPASPVKNDGAHGDRTVCSKCQGSVPWVEQDPHACEANGDICTECGRFRGIPAYEGNTVDTLLMDYCEGSEWEKVLQRVVYVPQETDFISSWRDNTTLHVALYSNAPAPVIQALVDAYPKAVSLHARSFGLPLWNAIDSDLSERVLDVVNILVRSDIEVLRMVQEEGVIESILGVLSGLFSERLVMAAELPVSEPMERVLALSKENKVNEGQVDMAFRQLSMLVKADYRGVLDDDSNECPLLNAIAGCRDPYFVSKDLLALAMRFHPEQLLRADENGDCPLHIAVSTINRDKGDYDNNYPWPDDFWEEDRLNEFLDVFCPHWDFDEYVENNCECECDREGANFTGCSCERDEDTRDGKEDGEDVEEETCRECCSKYINDEDKKCECYAEFKKYGYSEKLCDCREKFEWYDQKMTDEHRSDKKQEIEALLKACPVSAGFRDKRGRLPIHLAISNRKKWTGIEALLNAYPAALRARDPEHRLYPFMFAAHEEGTSDVDLTFELLCKDPMILVSIGANDMNAMAGEPGEARKRKVARTI